MHELPRTLKLATVWLLIGTAVFLGVQTVQSQRQRPQLVAAGGRLEIARAADGHYHWPGTLNGERVEFLVDTGATMTAIPQALAERIGLPAFDRITSSTANGPVHGTLSRGDLALDGGAQFRGLRLVVLPGLEAPLLGMNVLSRLDWTQRDGRLVVEPRRREPGGAQ